MDLREIKIEMTGEEFKLLIDEIIDIVQNTFKKDRTNSIYLIIQDHLFKRFEHNSTSLIPRTKEWFYEKYSEFYNLTGDIF